MNIILEPKTINLCKHVYRNIHSNGLTMENRAFHRALFRKSLYELMGWYYGRRVHSIITVYLDYKLKNYTVSKDLNDIYVRIQEEAKALDIPEACIIAYDAVVASAPGKQRDEQIFRFKLAWL